MKVGVTYSVFDAVELLQYSINCIRAHVDYINVVWQDVSYFGERDESVFGKLEKIKGVDKFIKYETNLGVKPNVNETAKRNVGLKDCINQGCKIWQTMDTDEMYVGSQYRKSLDDFIYSEMDASACQMQTYYKFVERVVHPAEQYFVSLWFRVHPGFELKQCVWDVDVDPSRKAPIKSLMLFDRSEIEMHHYSFIRKNIGQKFRNSSASVNWRNRIDERVMHWHAYLGLIGETVLHPHNGLNDFRPLTLIKANPPVVIPWASIYR